MSELLKRYCPRTEFDSYEDFYENYTCNVPENFNFAYDIVDEWARLDPQKPALVWTNDAGDIKRFTFGDMKRHSDQAANVFAAHGIKKGDVVMLILKQRPEVWMCMVALMKLGAKCIPATYQLTPKDIVYRCNRAQVKMIVCVDDDVVLDHIKNSVDECETLETIATVGTHPHEGLVDFCKELYAASDVFARPTGAEATQNSDPMLIFRHHRHAQDGVARLRLSAGTHCNGKILAVRAGRQNSHDPDRFRMGEVRMGKDLRPVDLRRLHRRLRHGEVQTSFHAGSHSAH